MIPKIVHQVFAMSETPEIPFGITHYVSALAALDKIDPWRMMIHYAYEPKTEWWAKLRQIEQLELVRVEPPKSIHGVPFLHFAHATDVVRLQALVEHGGIYLDSDVLCVRSFDDLLDNKCVIGIQRGVATIAEKPSERELCNAVLLAEPYSRFIMAWLLGFTDATPLPPGFDEREWCGMAVLYPTELSKLMPEELSTLDGSAFFSSLWDEPGLDQLFSDPTHRGPSGAYAFHLWESISYPRFRHLTVPDIKAGESLFCSIAKKYL